MTRIKSLAFTLALSALLPNSRAFAQTGEGLGAPVKANEGAQVDATKLTKVPKQTKFIEADYPKDARAKGIETDVILLLNINEKGGVDEASVAEPPNPPGVGFEEAALVAAQGFLFEPAEMNGKAIAVQISYRYKFRLMAKAPPPAAAPVPEVPTAAPAPVAVAPTATAEPVLNFSGRLLERGTRLPMPGVVVTIFRDVDGKAEGFEAPTDETGTFKFFDLAPSEWKVLVEAPGYFPFRTTELVKAGEAVNATFYVERGEYNPFDVTVTATRPKKEVNRTVLSAKEIDKIPGAAGDPLAVVQNFAGVARAQAFTGQIIVRGSAPEDTKVFVDGAEVPLIYHFGGLRSVLPVGVLDSIEFYPGNFSSQYGRATGGVIDVQVKKLQPKKVGGYADVSLLDTSLLLELPLQNKGGIILSARRSYVDAIINAVVPDDSPVGVVTAPRYYDYQFLANYRPSAAHDFRAFVFGSDDRLKLLFANPGELDTSLTDNAFSASTTFYRSLLTYKYIPNDRFENTLRVAQGRNWLNFKAGQLVFDLNFYTTQLRDTVRTRLSDKLSLSVGLDFLFSRSQYFIRLPRPPKEGEPPESFDGNKTFTATSPRDDFWSPAGFVELEYRQIEKLLILPGIRVDHFSRVSQTIAQPRLTARWQLSEPWTIKGGAGLFGQEPDFEETNRDFGNPKLKVEQALHYSLGAEYKPRPHITLDGTVFYKDMRDLVGRTNRVITEGNVTRPLVYDNGSTGKVYGLEFVARHEFTDKFSGWATYTLSRSVRNDSDTNTERLFDFDQTHILTLIGTYLLPRNWQIGSRFRLVSGNPRTPAQGGVFNASTDRYDPVYGAVNSGRNAAFHQLDLRIDKRWVYQNWMLNLYLDVQNVYNRANQEGLSYNYDFTKSQTQQGLPLLTILGVRAEF